MTAVLSAALEARAQTEFRGQEVYDLAKRSIDVTGIQLQMHQARHRYGAFDWYMAYNGRWAPGEFVMADGSRLSGNLARHQVGLGGGVGDLGAGFFLGVQGDAVGAAGPPGPADPDSTEFKPIGMAQGLTFLGASFAGVQATVGLLFNQLSASTLELDSYGNFDAQASSRNEMLRPGTPTERVASEYARDDPPNSVLLTAFEGTTGAYVAIAYGDLEERRIVDTPQGRYFSMERTGSGIQDARIHLQPLRPYLPSWAGLPFLSVARYSTPATDLPETSLPTVSAPQVDLPSAPDVPPVPDAKTTDYAFGSDDVLEGGLRWRLVVSSTVGLRVAEFGYIEEFRSEPVELLVGARAMAVDRRDQKEPAGEGFVRFSLLRDEPAVRGRVAATWLGVALSYSYNSPDNTTFLAIPQAHVFGVQLAFGPSEMALPLVPLVRAAEASRDED